MELWEAILLAAFTGIVGFFSNQILHNLAVKKDNIQVNRDRLLLNVYQVDNFIKSLIEINNVRNKIARIKELIESSNTDYELLSEESNLIGDELNSLEEELKEHIDPEKITSVKTKICSLSTRLEDISSELKQKKFLHQTMEDNIDLNEKILNDLHKRTYLEDIIPALFFLDSTGDLVDDFTDLTHIYLDSESQTTSDTKALILRLKIERFINNKIKTFK